MAISERSAKLIVFEDSEAVLKTLGLCRSRVRNTMTNAGLILRIRIFIGSKGIRGTPSLHSEPSTHRIVTGSCTQLGAYGRSCRRKSTSIGVDD